MIWIYLASAIFGGGFLIPMILGGLDTDMEVEFDTDVEVGELDAGGDVGSADADGGDSGAASAGLGAAEAIVGSLLSFRSLVFFASFFGVVGLVLTYMGFNFIATAIAAAVLGLFAAGLNSVVFGLLESSETSSQVTEREFGGKRGSVTVPIEGSRRGRIRIDLAGQPHYLMAEAYDGQEVLGQGNPVVVVALENGIAKVAALPELEGI